MLQPNVLLGHQTEFGDKGIKPNPMLSNDTYPKKEGAKGVKAAPTYSICYFMYRHVTSCHVNPPTGSLHDPLQVSHRHKGCIAHSRAKLK